MERDRETFGGVRIYNVNTDVFQGPFDVLLDLIEKRKLFINDIALAQVADDFIKYVQDQNRFPLEESAHFILIASTLILIKSKSLLPSLDLTEEEEEDIGRLEDRLKVYKEVKKEAERLKDNWGVSQMFFGKGEDMSITVSFMPDESVAKESLLNVASEIINRVSEEKALPQVNVDEKVKLKTVINSLVSRISAETNMNFRDFVGLRPDGVIKDEREKRVVIVSFIALLELVKQGMAVAYQGEGGNSDIYIENTDKGYF
ncbi:MAG: segregation and condensation protein A [Patescibacteria group bacterium]